MSVMAVIPTRLESTRFPGKALADATGKTLIEHAWDVACGASRVSRVLVATDSTRIAECVTAFGGDVVMTGAHPNGTSRIAEAVADLEASVIVNMQGDEPELDPAVIDVTVDALLSRDDCPMATAVCPLTPQDRADSNVVKAIVSADGTAAAFSRIMPEDGDPWRHLGLYVYRSAFLAEYVAMPPTEQEIAQRLEQLRVLDNGIPIAIARVSPQPHGIDTPEQYSQFLQRRGGD